MTTGKLRIVILVILLQSIIMVFFYVWVKFEVIRRLFTTKLNNSVEFTTIYITLGDTVLLMSKKSTCENK